MKHRILFCLFIFFAVFFASAAQSSPISAAQNLNLKPDSVVFRDSLSTGSVLDSIDSAFKYTEIIPRTSNDNNFLIVRIKEQLARGGHDLLFGLELQNQQHSEKVLDEGQLKIQRPMWVLVVTFILFLLLGFIRLAFPVELKIIVDAYLKERLLLQVSKEDNLATSWPYIFLYTLFSLSLGLFIVLVMSGYSDKNYLTFENFLKNSIFVAVLFIVKIILIRFVSFIFSLEKIVREYIAVLYLVYFNCMFLLLPFLLALVFVPVSYFPIITFVYIILTIALFAYRVFRTAFHLFANFRFSIFYLILYLCSLELAPILILVRALSK